MSSDTTNRGNLPDVPWQMAGVGHISNAKCEARKGYFLCGKPIANKGHCRDCKEARAARAGKGATA